MSGKDTNVPSKEYISREAAMSFPFANDQYDHVHADPHFIAGCETYKEWLSIIPAADVVKVVRCGQCIRKDICRTSNVWAVSPDDNWFCADGERKDGGQDE